MTSKHRAQVRWGITGFAKNDLAIAKDQKRNWVPT